VLGRREKGRKKVAEAARRDQKEKDGEKKKKTCLDLAREKKNPVPFKERRKGKTGSEGKQVAPPSKQERERKSHTEEEEGGSGLTQKRKSGKPALRAQEKGEGRFEPISPRKEKRRGGKS